MSKTEREEYEIFIKGRFEAIAEGYPEKVQVLKELRRVFALKIDHGSMMAKFREEKKEHEKKETSKIYS